MFIFCYSSLLCCLHFVFFFFHTNPCHWRGSIVVFLPRTLHTNSIYNFCTFVLSNFILDLTVQLLLKTHTTHSYSRTHVLPLQIGIGTRVVNLTLSLSLHRLPAFLLVATLFFSTNKSYFSTSFGLSCCHILVAEDNSEDCQTTSPL